LTESFFLSHIPKKADEALEDKSLILDGNNTDLIQVGGISPGEEPNNEDGDNDPRRYSSFISDI
jgi:hypothetical protein